MSKSRLYELRRWRRLRLSVLDEFPACAKCNSPATQVDHIIPAVTGRIDFFDRGNLQSLCASCHSKKTRRDNKKVRGKTVLLDGSPA